ncbi:hypothetical protein [Mariniblastus fucicola]|uniref:Uncharacterized protein n=1 Tax=Mariniblastus fucicola TaxID=980251 RepID=A0A5B9P8S7_9BACT|nr:hypothetical protein [Mariniblastus fucicola]QEG22698.1 hypothetical protein MFFC18_25810 [Mariniblastus fucicola]
MKAPPSHRFAFALAFAMSVAVLSMANHCQAQTARPAYKVEYIDTWPRTNQIKYIRVSITSLNGIASEDLDFYVVGVTTGNSIGTRVSTKVSIRKGDTSATGELYIPAASGYNMSLHTEIDGDLRYNRGDFAYRNYYDYHNVDLDNGRIPTFVIASSEIVADDSVSYIAMSRAVSPKVPTFTRAATSDDFFSLSDLDPWYTNANANVGGGKDFVSLNGFSSSLVGAISLDKLPSRWFGYEGLGFLMMTHSDLKTLAKTHPGKMLAIERWVAASGRLVVLNCGDKLEKADEVLSLLGDSNSDLRANRSSLFYTEDVDMENVDLAREAALLDANRNSSFYYNGMGQTVDEVEAPVLMSTMRDSFGATMKAGRATNFLAVDFELGQVVCVSDVASDWKTEKTQNLDRWGALAGFLSRTRKSSGSGNRVLHDRPYREFGFPEFAEPPRFLFEFRFCYTSSPSGR